MMMHWKLVFGLTIGAFTTAPSAALGQATEISLAGGTTFGLQEDFLLHSPYDLVREPAPQTLESRGMWSLDVATQVNQRDTFGLLLQYEGFRIKGGVFGTRGGPETLQIPTANGEAWYLAPRFRIQIPKAVVVGFCEVGVGVRLERVDATSAIYEIPGVEEVLLGEAWAEMSGGGHAKLGLVIGRPSSPRLIVSGQILGAMRGAMIVRSRWAFDLGMVFTFGDSSEAQDS